MNEDPPSLLGLKRKVWDHHPNAAAHFNNDTNKFKIYHKVGDCLVALSASWDTASMAWHEAAANLEAKHGTGADDGRAAERCGDGAGKQLLESSASDDAEARV